MSLKFYVQGCTICWNFGICFLGGSIHQRRYSNVEIFCSDKETVLLFMLLVHLVGLLRADKVCERFIIKKTENDIKMKRRIRDKGNVQQDTK